MNFSTTRRGEYGLTAMLYMARPQGRHLAQIHDIAEHCALPEPFLGQILRLLVRGGLIHSKKGVGGGFTLARKPEEISFLEVLEALEGPVAVNRCQSPVEHCQNEGNCSMEFVWARAQDALLGVLRETTLADAFCTGHFPFTPAASVSSREKPAVIAGSKTP
jgi:Rrf2 family protein